MRQNLGIAALLVLLAAPAWPEPIRLIGRIVPAEAPGARVELRAYPRNGEPGPSPVTAEPAADGTFVLTAPKPGLYRLTVQAKGSLEDALAPLPVVEDANLPWLFLRAPGTPEESPRRPTPSAPPVIQKGRVLDSVTQAPLPGALVWETGLDAKEDVTWTWTDADGRFQLALHGPDPTIGAAAPGHVQIPRYRLTPAPSVTLSLPPAATLAGQIVDSKGQPVAGAFVGVDPTDPGFAMGRPEGNKVRTGADGGFLLRTLTPETSYRLSVEADGFVSSWKEFAVGKPGQEMQPVRIVLSAGMTVTGRTVDSDGLPVAGADLTFLTTADGPEGTRASLWKHLRATSDATGRFRFEHVGTGDYQMQVMRPGFAPAYRAGTVGTNPQGVVDLGDLLLETGAVIEGRVTDPRGMPLAGAQISSPEQASRRNHLFFSPEEKPTFTAADGSFRISDLEPGRLFSFSVEKPGYLLMRLPGVEAPTREPLHVELRPARSLSGRVLDTERRPVAGARISRIEVHETGIGNNSSFGRSSFRLGETDPEGRFSVSGLEPGLLRLEARAPGFRASELSGISILEDEEPTPVEIVLETGAVLEGRVLDAKGQPLHPAQVRIVPRESKWAFGPSFWTDEDGHYRADVEPGEYRVVAALFGFNLQAEGKVTVGDSGTYHLDLRLPAGVPVSGHVTGEQGEPLQGASISLQGEPQFGFSVESAEDGSFRFKDVPDGTYRLYGSSRGYVDEDSPDEVQVNGQEVGGLVLRLSRGGTISGRILGIDDEDRLSIRLVARPGDGGSPEDEMLMGMVGTGGVYRLPTVAPGVWRVKASLPSGLSASGIARVAPGEEVTLDLEMPRGLALSGRVLLDGQPLSGASVSVPHSVEPGAIDDRQPAARTRYDGSFVIRGLRPGRFTLSVLSGSIHHTRDLDLSTDREITVEILTGQLSGHVFAAGGTPVEGAILSLRAGDPGEQGVWSETLQGRTDDHGAFEVPRLAAGSYRITAQAPGFGEVAQTVVVTPGGTTEVQVVLKGD